MIASGLDDAGQHGKSLTMMRRSSPLPLVLTLIAGMGGLFLTLAAFWPGLMTWDSVRQYDQALSGEFDDWHPPAMEWLWRLLVPIHQGPLLMFLLQVALLWVGVALLAFWAWRERRPWLAFGQIGRAHV